MKCFYSYVFASSFVLCFSHSYITIKAANMIIKKNRINDLRIWGKNHSAINKHFLKFQCLNCMHLNYYYLIKDGKLSKFCIKMHSVYFGFL